MTGTRNPTEKIPSLPTSTCTANWRWACRAPDQDKSTRSDSICTACRAPTSPIPAGGKEWRPMYEGGKMSKRVKRAKRPDCQWWARMRRTKIPRDQNPSPPEYIITVHKTAGRTHKSQRRPEISVFRRQETATCMCKHEFTWLSSAEQDGHKDVQA